jgi:signal transduction histidine kinase/ligand-binding sensor domain-containing protein
MRHIALFTIASILQILVASEMGRPYINNYLPDEYGAAPQNWAITQDQRGVMYFGNTSGVLEYDGSKWRTIPLPNNHVVRSLASDDAGTIWVGGRDELGFLQADSSGRLGYVSLLGKLPADLGKIGDVWRTHYHNGRILYFSTLQLMIYTNEQLRVIKPQGSFHLSHLVNDQYYIMDRGVGLKQLQGDSLVLAPGGTFFRDMSIYFMAAFGSDSLLLGTRSNGFYVYADGNITPLAINFSDKYKQSVLYGGLRLQDSLFALSTLQAGVLLMDRRGRLVGEINEKSGLENLTITKLFQDQQKGLWVAAANGISRIEYPAAFTLFDKRDGLRSFVMSVIRFREQLYIATFSGLYMLKQGATGTEVEKIEAVNDVCYDLEVYQDALLIAAGAGVYSYEPGKPLERIFRSGKDRSVLELLPSAIHQNVVYIGTDAGFMGIQKRNSDWQAFELSEATTGEIFQIVEDSSGTVWFGTVRDGVMRISGLSFAGGKPGGYSIGRFSEPHGLPTNNEILAFMVPDLRFATGKGIYYFDETKQRFAPDRMVFSLIDSAQIYQMAYAGGTSYWIYEATKDVAGLITLQGENRTWDYRLFRRFAHLGETHSIYPENDGVVWFGTGNGLVRYDPRLGKDIDQPYSALLRQVSVNGDSVIFGGYHSPYFADPVLEYADNTLRFEYAAPSYDDASENRFQTYLEGFDDEWSDWTNENYIDYKKISEGDYVFHVRARNIYETLSASASFAFTIHPPLHRTTSAFGLYLLLAGFSGFGLVRWRSYALEKENRRLEGEVTKRTAEIKRQAEEIQKTQAQLFQSEKMAALGQMVAGMAHEINTPVGVVVTATSLLQENSNKIKTLFDANNMSVSELDEFIHSTIEIGDIQRKNIDRAADLVRSFKQVAVDQSHDEKRRINLKDYIDEVILSLDPRIRPTGHRVSVRGDAEIMLHTYPGAIAQIITNLLLNSLQHAYTEGQKGEIEIDVKVDKAITIIYSDDGRGVSAEAEEKIFDPFFTTARGTGGSGLGLHIVYNLVHHKLKGRISYAGSPGTGARFIIHLSRSRNGKGNKIMTFFALR